MNEELQTQLLEYLKQAVELGKDQLHLFAEEICRAGVFDAYISIATGIVFISILLASAIVGARYVCPNERQCFKIVSMALVVTLSFLTLTIIIPDIKNIYKAKNTPRVYVLEKLGVI